MIDLQNKTIEEIKLFFNQNKNEHKQIHEIKLSKEQIHILELQGFRIYESVFNEYTISE